MAYNTVAFKEYSSITAETSGLDIPRPTNLAIGDLMVAHVSTTWQGVPYPPSDWTTISSSQGTGGYSWGTVVAYKIADAVDVMSGSVYFWVDVYSTLIGSISTYTNFDTVTPIDISAVKSTDIGGGSTTVLFDTITPRITPQMLVMLSYVSIATTHSDWQITTDNPTWTEQYNTSSLYSTQGLATATRTSADSTGTGQVTIADSTQSLIGIILIINPDPLEYPFVGDVREGITYGLSGTQYTGTLDIPSVGNVRWGITYGSGETEYTGTYLARQQVGTYPDGIPSYVTLLSGIVDGLKSDSRMSAVADEFIYYGPERSIPAFPAITVELAEAQELWKTFPCGKDSNPIFRIRIYDEAYDYTTGLQSVEDIARSVNHVLNARTGFSGLVYQSDIQGKTFAMYDFDDVPVFGCELELATKTRFAPAT